MFAANSYVIHHVAGDCRVVANPFQHTARLVSLLRMRARAIRQAVREPSVRARLRAGIRVATA